MRQAPVYARANFSAQTIANATQTKITTFSVSFEKPSGMISTANDEIVVPEGVYSCGAQLSWAASAVGERQVRILANGAATEILNDIRPNGGAFLQYYTVQSSLVQLTANWDVELWVYQGSGGNLDISGSLFLHRIPHL